MVEVVTWIQWQEVCWSVEDLIQEVWQCRRSNMATCHSIMGTSTHSTSWEVIWRLLFKIFSSSPPGARECWIINSPKDIVPIYEISSNLVEICLICRLIRKCFGKSKINIVCKRKILITNLKRKKIRKMSKTDQLCVRYVCKQYCFYFYRIIFESIYISGISPPNLKRFHTLEQYP